MMLGKKRDGLTVNPLPLLHQTKTMCMLGLMLKFVALWA